VSASLDKKPTEELAKFMNNNLIAFHPFFSKPNMFNLFLKSSLLQLPSKAQACLEYCSQLIEYIK